MEPYQQRVVDEAAELDGRITRLAAFVHSQAGHQIDPPERRRLILQLSLMRALAMVLEDRITHFAP